MGYSIDIQRANNAPTAPLQPAAGIPVVGGGGGGSGASGEVAVTNHENKPDPHPQYVLDAGGTMTGALAIQDMTSPVSGDLHIGPAAPAGSIFDSVVQIVTTGRDAARARLSLVAVSDDALVAGFNCYKARGTVSVPAPVQSGDRLWVGAGVGFGGTWRASAAVEQFATEAWSVGATGSRVSLAATANGSTTRQIRFTVFGTGALALGPSLDQGANQQLIQSGGPGAAASWVTPYWLPLAGGTMTGAILGAVGSAAAPSLSVSGDPDTGVYFPAADTWAVSTGGAERMRIDSAGRHVIGHTSTFSTSGAVVPSLQVAGVNASTAGMAVVRASADTGDSRLVLAKARGALASPTAVASADALSAIRFEGYGSTGFQFAGQIAAIAREAFTDTAVGTEIVMQRALLGSTTQRSFFAAGASGAVSIASHDLGVVVSGGGSGAFRQNLSVTGAASSVGNLTSCVLGSDTTTVADLYRAQITNTAASTAYTAVNGFVMAAPTLGAGASIGTYQAFNVQPMTNATTIRAYVGSIAAASGRHNLFMSGTAANYLEGSTGIGTSTPTAKLDINADTLRLRSSRTPASATAAGNPGEICWDANYVYICIAANTWRRIAHATW